MEPIFVATDIQVDDISLCQWPGVWNTVTDALVDWCAARSGVAIVIQWWRISSLTNDILMHNAINFFSGYPWSNDFVALVTRVSCNLADFSDYGNFFLGMHGWCLICQLLKVLIWLSSLSIIRPLDISWHFSLSCKWVWEWSQRSSVIESLLYLLISLLMSEFVHSP